MRDHEPRDTSRQKADLGAPATMVTCPGAPHRFGGSIGTDTASDVQSRVLAWLDAHIEPGTDR